jgi:DNA processing protein
MNLDDDALARLTLLHAAEPGSRAIGGFVQTYGPQQALQRIKDGAGPTKNPEVLQRRLANVNIDEDLARLTELACDFITPSSAGWPSRCDDLGTAAPLGLLVRGTLPLRTTALRSVAIVGARAATEYGMRLASDFASEIGQSGISVVSGAAFGIDAAAHHGALAVDAPTIAVVACGIDVVYPAAHDVLFGKLLDRGVIVTEVPPGRRPTRSGFLARNRLIAALTVGTVVVEAAHRSGALNTATWAGDLQRHVMAVPGSVMSATSTGCHRLIRDGATLVASARDVLEQVGDIGAALDTDSTDSSEPQVLDGVPADVATVFELLPVRTAKSPEALAAESGFEADFVLTALGHLLLLGAVRYGPQGWSAVPGVRGTPGRRP